MLFSTEITYEACQQMLQSRARCCTVRAMIHHGVWQVHLSLLEHSSWQEHRKHTWNTLCTKRYLMENRINRTILPKVIIKVPINLSPPPLHRCSRRYCAPQSWSEMAPFNEWRPCGILAIFGRLGQLRYCRFGGRLFVELRGATDGR